MSDPRYEHEYIPGKHGKCKHIVGYSICGQGEMVVEHHRWAVRESGVHPVSIPSGESETQDATPRNPIKHSKRVTGTT